MTEQPPQFVPPQMSAAQMPPAENQSKGFPIASLILGIVSLFGPGILVGIPAIVFGSIALKQKNPARSMSITGIVTGSIGTVLSLFVILFMIFIINSLSSGNWRNEQMPSNTGSPSVQDPRT